MKIFLIGMPGSGKTTLGRRLAERLGVDFVDLDHEIERSESKSISEIFSQQGEDAFRLLESKLLRQWASSNLPFVMATGGGAPCFYNGMATINESGVSVFLDCPVSELIARVKKNQERPLLLTADDQELTDRLTRMLENRMACYRQAKVILRNPTIEAVLEALGVRR